MPVSPIDREKKIEEIRKQISDFPDSPGIYLFKNAYDTVLYVGKAVSLKKRVASYFNKTSLDSPKIRSLVSQVDHLEFIVTTDESQAFLLESNLIKRHRPRYNVVLRDDKSYPYLKLTTQENFPRILISRRPSADGASYYGPFPNLKLREISKMIYRYFNIRDCDIEIDGRAERACLSYQIKQCPAPCIGAIDKAGYSLIVDRVKWFLEGKHEPLIDHIKMEMLQAADRQEYEEAAKYRDLLTSVEQMQSSYAMITSEKLDLDVVALTPGLGKVLASVLQVRQGKVIDHIKLTLENELELPLHEVLPMFLQQFYVPGVFIPGEILIAKGFELESFMERWLSKQKGNSVILRNPKSGWREHTATGACSVDAKPHPGRCERMAGSHRPAAQPGSGQTGGLWIASGHFRPGHLLVIAGAERGFGQVPRGQSLPRASNAKRDIENRIVVDTARSVAERGRGRLLQRRRRLFAAPCHSHSGMRWSTPLVGWRTVFGGTVFGSHDDVKTARRHLYCLADQGLALLYREAGCDGRTD